MTKPIPPEESLQEHLPPGYHNPMRVVRHH
jgi:hypothetical protein